MGSIILRRGMKPSEETLRRIYANAPKSDDEIDYSDIPKMTKEELARMKPARLRERKSVKKAS